MPKRRIVIYGVSERTIETNILADISYHIQTKYNRKVTIVSPTQRQEEDLAFDETFLGLPGKMLYLQFKRPYDYRPTNRNWLCARFYIKESQQLRLLGNFHPSESYYALVPFPHLGELTRNRQRLLQLGVALDPHRVPNAYKKGQNSRTVKVIKSVKPNADVADPRVYEKAIGTITLETLSNLLGNLEIGFRWGEIRTDDSEIMQLMSYGGYFLHVSQARGLD